VEDCVGESFADLEHNAKALGMLEEELGACRRGVRPTPYEQPVVFTLNVPEQTLSASDGRSIRFRTGNAWYLLVELAKRVGERVETTHLIEVLGQNPLDSSEAPKYAKARLGEKLKHADLDDLFARIESGAGGYVLNLPVNHVHVIPAD